LKGWRSLLIGMMSFVLFLASAQGSRGLISDREASAGNQFEAISYWYDLAWHWRKPITISNSFGSLSNYQVKVVLNTQELIAAGKLQPDGDDLRFTDADKITEIPYWIESGINTPSTVIWVKVPSLPVGNHTIYVYYGNPAATRGSNGSATFEFFDDFEDGINSWMVVEGAWTESSGIMIAERGTPPEDRAKRTFVDPGNDYAYEYRMKIWDLDGNGYPWGGLEIKSSWVDVPNYDTGYFGCSYASGGTSVSNKMKLWRANGGIAQLGSTAGATIEQDVWYDYRIVYHEGNLEYYLNGTLKVSAYDFTYPTGEVVRLIKNNDDASVAWDDVRIRKYVSPEPVVTEIGLEE